MANTNTTREWLIYVNVGDDCVDKLDEPFVEVVDIGIYDADEVQIRADSTSMKFVVDLDGRTQIWTRDGIKRLYLALGEYLGMDARRNSDAVTDS